MREMLRRLAQMPFVAVRLIAATCIVNLLGFASPLFVMIILGQYTSTGFDGTLVTLSVGMLLAMLLQVGFRQTRTAMAAVVSVEPDRRLSETVFDVLARARTSALERVPPVFRSELSAHVRTIQLAYSAPNISNVLDAPFCFLFFAATFWFSPMVGSVGVLGALFMLGFGLLHNNQLKLGERRLQKAVMALRGMTATLWQSADAIRMFGAEAFVGSGWREQGKIVSRLRQRTEQVRGAKADMTLSVPVLVRVVVYAVGAKEVVLGSLGFVELIVANILVGRALRMVSSFVGTGEQLARAGHALQELNEFFKLPLEPESGTALRQYGGRLEFRDVSFAYPGSSGPLFESLTLSLGAGQVLVVHGPNGAGKTTLARLITGLMDPMRGEVLVDGINLRQIAPPWWRKQLVYVPQEPTFLDATIAENIRSVNDAATDDEIEHLVQLCGLERYLATTSQGLQTPIAEMGRHISLGVRRRLAFARALATNGRLVVIDEPFEGLDPEGEQVVRGIIESLMAKGCTLIVLSSSKDVVPRSDIFLDLGAKPVPVISLKHSANARKAQYGA